MDLYLVSTVVGDIGLGLELGLGRASESIVQCVLIGRQKIVLIVENYWSSCSAGMALPSESQRLGDFLISSNMNWL